jgi:hypothetical protein
MSPLSNPAAVPIRAEAAEGEWSSSGLRPEAKPLSAGLHAKNVPSSVGPHANDEPSSPGLHARARTEPSSAGQSPDGERSVAGPAIEEHRPPIGRRRWGSRATADRPLPERGATHGVPSAEPASVLGMPGPGSGMPGAEAGLVAVGGAEAAPERTPEPESSGRHTVPDGLVRGSTYRLPPDRVFRAKVPEAVALPEEPTTRLPKPRS